MTRKPKPLGEAELREYALKSLAARAQSEGELRAKLERRATRKADVEPVIQRLKEAGYLDDARFAEAFAGYRLENQCYGKRRVERELRARKVAAPLAESAIRSAYEDTDEPALIREHIARHIRRKGKPADRKAVASLFRHLVGAGFSPSHIFPELRRISKEDAEAIEEASEAAI